MLQIEGNKSALYQWDLNQRLILTGVNSGAEVHYSKPGYGCLVTKTFEEEENGIIYSNIPNIMLQSKGIISVYVYVQEDNEAYTNHNAEILVLFREKPADYVYEETDVINYDSLLKRIERLETAGGAINGIPPGGKAGQLLCKKSDDDYDVEWTDLKIPEQYGLVTYNQDKIITIT